MKNNEYSVKYHSTAQKAYDETTKDGITAAKITTYYREDKKEIEFVSFKGEIEDYPYSLGSNQSIEEIDQDAE